jgi:hypothetical protein
MKVLILSTSTNEHSLAIEKYLGNIGAEVIRFDTDKVQEGFVSVDVKSDSVTFNGRRFLSNEITSVFSHHPRISVPKGQGIDHLDWQLCQSSWINCVDWLEQVFADLKWLNKPSVCRSTASVMLQLKMAHEIGVNVPDACFTNNIDELTEFSFNHERIILKPGPLVDLFTSGQRILAHIINPEKIKTDDKSGELKSAPCLFQGYLEKLYELRVHVIGQDVYACKIESQENNQTKIDWRDYDLSKTPHYPINISEDITDKCRKIVHRLGLNFGIIDLVVTPDNETYFLECNSQGHWLWIEYLTGLPITEAVGASLLSPS